MQIFGKHYLRATSSGKYLMGQSIPKYMASMRCVDQKNTYAIDIVPEFEGSISSGGITVPKPLDGSKIVKILGQFIYADVGGVDKAAGTKGEFTGVAFIITEEPVAQTPSDVNDLCHWA